MVTKLKGIEVFPMLVILVITIFASIFVIWIVDTFFRPHEVLSSETQDCTFKTTTSRLVPHNHRSGKSSYTTYTSDIDYIYDCKTFSYKRGYIKENLVVTKEEVLVKGLFGEYIVNNYVEK